MAAKTSRAQRRLRDDILGRLVRRYSTATVLLHQAIALRLGLGPADHKCLDLLLERGSMTGSELVAITGLTSGAITGVVARLERAGYLRRDPDPDDGRRQVLTPVAETPPAVERLFASLRAGSESLVDGFDSHQLAAIAEFLVRGTEYSHQRAALLRAQMLGTGGRTRPAGARARPAKEAGS